MTLTHTGSTKKFASGWENIFGGKKKLANGAKPATKKKAVAKKKRKS
ncbi:MAG TPA: hypothetical protein VJ783_31770 [Pirellulales bacterium]|nr:hypothetical protein [Pirellulales bacterium]